MNEISQFKKDLNNNGIKILHQDKVELPGSMKAFLVCQTVKFRVYEFRVVPT